MKLKKMDKYIEGNVMESVYQVTKVLDFLQNTQKEFLHTGIQKMTEN